MSQLSPPEVKAIQWIRTWTVPNTRTASGEQWTTKNLPPTLTAWRGYDSTIAPAAWAAAIVANQSLSKGIFRSGDYYRSGSVTGSQYKRCKCFDLPAQLPPRSTFPVGAFTFSACQGTAVVVDSANQGNQKSCDCTCQSPCSGQLIGPSQKCQDKSWLNGMWGVQQNRVKGVSDLIARAENIYKFVHPKEASVWHVLDNTVRVAGFPRGSSVYENVMRCVPPSSKNGKPVQVSQLSSACADLMSIWLVRNHLVRLTVALDERITNNFDGVKALARYFNSGGAQTGSATTTGAKPPSKNTNCVFFCEPYHDLGPYYAPEILSQSEVPCPNWLDKSQNAEGQSDKDLLHGDYGGEKSCHYNAYGSACLSYEE